ncbi:MAG TPA: dihydrofolate reductase family protein [Solirubrobacterales bacterium]|nr:dihydrofolate reductase family protein [Solirubrobacterales bacterium]
MAKLIYSAIGSLDGYTADETGSFDWAYPGEEVHGFINDLERPVGTYLYGRRMYETMAAWETDPSLAEGSDVSRDFAQIWRAADKIVYSKTLESASTERTRIEREFDPAAIRQLKAAAESDLAVGGPNLAAQAFEARLIDECQLFLAPIVVGGGKRMLPDDLRLELELLAERRFGNGMVHLRYRAET